jgi:hypothetical protein
MDRVSGILDYHEPPGADEHRRRSRTLWLFAAVTLSMVAIGYAIMAMMIL